jgi:hypothetical protein
MTTSPHPGAFTRAGRLSRLWLSAVGPRDVDADPIGGAELAGIQPRGPHPAEIFGGNFGVVPFFDGGTLSTGAFQRKDWQFGAGLSVRYYSSFGPIRLDDWHAAQPAQRTTAVSCRARPGAGLLMVEAAVTPK